MSLEIGINKKYRDMPSLEIDLTREETEISEQVVYDAIEKHLMYLNEVITGLRMRIQSSLKRIDLMEANR